MKPSRYGPFPYSPIIHRPALKWPDGAHVALWIIPEYRILRARRKSAPRLRRHRRAGARRPDLVGARLRQSRRRVPPHGGTGKARHPRHRRAQQRAVHRASRHHQGRQQAEMGVDGPLREQYATPQCRSRPARSRASSRTRSPSSRRRPARARAAGLAPAYRRPGTRSTCSPTTASIMSAIGPMTTSPTS